MARAKRLSLFHLLRVAIHREQMRNGSSGPEFDAHVVNDLGCVAHFPNGSSASWFLIGAFSACCFAAIGHLIRRTAERSGHSSRVPTLLVVWLFVYLAFLFFLFPTDAAL